MKILASSILAVLLSLTSANAISIGELSNDCAIVAAEAIARISLVTKWSKILEFQYVSVDDDGIPRIYGHEAAIWQVGTNGPIMIYTTDGTIELKTHSRKLSDIVGELNARLPSTPIISAHFVE